MNPNSLFFGYIFLCTNELPVYTAVPLLSAITAFINIMCNLNETDTSSSDIRRQFQFSKGTALLLFTLKPTLWIIVTVAVETLAGDFPNMSE